MLRHYGRRTSVSCDLFSFNGNRQLQVSSRNRWLDDALNNAQFNGQLGISLSPDLAQRMVFQCTKKSDLGLVTQMHYLFLHAGLDCIAALATQLIRLYVSCGSLFETNQVFHKVTKPNEYTWNALIAAHAKLGKGKMSFLMYESMEHTGTSLSIFTFPSILKACASTASIQKGRCIHQKFMHYKLQTDVVVESALVDMYCKCGALEEGQIVFDRMTERDVVAWGAMITGYTQYGEGHLALACYGNMQQTGIKPDKVIFSSVLKACGGVGALENGRHIHEKIIKIGLQSHIIVGSTLIDMYSRCASMEEAHRVHSLLQNHDVVSWSAMIAGYAQHGMGELALEYFEDMHIKGIKPDKVTFLSILKACSTITSIQHGRYVHEKIFQAGLHFDMVIGSTLLDMYVKCGSLEEACGVFDKLSNWDLVAWSAMIAGYAEYGKGILALQCFKTMQQEGIKPDKVTFSSILKGCSSIGSVEQGRCFHEQIVQNGLTSDVVVGSSLVDMYARCNCLEEARAVFNSLLDRNTLVWSAMIVGYAQHDNCQLALECFDEMLHENIDPNKTTLLNILKACCSMGAIEQSRRIHAETIDRGLHCDAVVGSALVETYVKCGSLPEANGVFERLPDQNVFAWGALIAGYAQFGEDQFALKCLEDMRHEDIRPTKVMFISILKSCGSICALEQGRYAHEQIFASEIEFDIDVENTLAVMYCKCGSLNEVCRIFDKLMTPDVISWNVMIMAFTQHNEGPRALECLQDMQWNGITPTKVTFSGILKTCGAMGAIEHGRQINEQIMENKIHFDLVVGSTIVDMYVKCGSFDEALIAFNMLENRDVVSWGALIAGCVQHGEGLLALECYDHMWHDDVEPDKITFVNTLKACGSIGAIHQGRFIHGQVIQCKVQCDDMLVDMYAKCGSLEEALQIFDKLPNTNLPSWHAMITGYAQLGEATLAVKCFEDMQSFGIEPDDTAFSGILTALNRAGLMDDALQYFKSMMEDHGIQPDLYHITCVVDVLGHMGCFNEAENFLQVTARPDICLWTALLSACRAHCNLELGGRCFDAIVHLDPFCDAAYVLMANIYARSQIRDNAIRSGTPEQYNNLWTAGRKWLYERQELVNDTNKSDNSEIPSYGLKRNNTKMRA